MQRSPSILVSANMKTVRTMENSSSSRSSVSSGAPLAKITSVAGPHPLPKDLPNLKSKTAKVDFCTARLLPTSNCSGILFVGDISKKKSSWKRRFCVLVEHCLFICKDQKSAPKEVIGPLWNFEVLDLGQMGEFHLKPLEGKDREGSVGFRGEGEDMKKWVSQLVLFSRSSIEPKTATESRVQLFWKLKDSQCLLFNETLHFNPKDEIDVYYKGKNGMLEVAVKRTDVDFSGKFSAEDFGARLHGYTTLRVSELIKVYGYHFTENNLYIVTEYSSLGTLEYYMYKDKLTPLQICNIASCMMKSLITLHKTGNTHAELEPSAIIVDSWEKGAFKLNNWWRSNMMQANIKPQYRAPELAQKSSQSPQIDIFSFAIILWELSTGRRITSVMSEVASKGHDSLQRPPLPEDPTFATIIARCWHPDPNERPSCEAVQREIISLSSFYKNVGQMEAMVKSQVNSIKRSPQATKTSPAR